MIATLSRDRAMKLTALLAILAMLAAEAFAVPIRYLVNDDYQMLYTAWLRSCGEVPLRDFGIQSYHILPDLLAPWLKMAGPSLEAAIRLRWVFWAGLAVLPLAVHALGRRMLPRGWALFAAVASLATWAVLERGLDIRPDLLMSLLWLWLIIRAADGEPAILPNVLSGALLAAALILRIKAALILPSLLLLAIDGERFRTSFRDGIRDLSRRMAAQGLGAAVVAGAFLGYLEATHQIPYFIAGNRVLAGIAKSGLNRWDIHKVAFGGLLSHDWPFVLLVLGGLAWFISRGRRELGKGWKVGWAVLLAAALLVGTDPAFYSYNFVILLPLLSVFAAMGCGWLMGLGAGGEGRRWAGPVLLAALPAWHLPMLWRMATVPTNLHQLALAKAIEDSRQETVFFAMEGLGLFRPSLHDWRMSAVSVPLYFSGKIDLGRQLRDTRPEVLLTSYRIPGWLADADRQWMGDHYVMAPGGAGLLGAKVEKGGAARSLLVPRAQPFAVIGDPCAIDGVRRQPGNVFTLEPGEHGLSDSDGTSIVCYAWPGLHILAAAPQAPLLISPDTAVYEGEGVP